MSDPLYSPEFDAHIDTLFAAKPQGLAFADWKAALPGSDRDRLILTSLLAQQLNGGLAQWVDNGYHEEDIERLLDLLGEIAANSAGERRGAVDAVRDVLARVTRTLANDQPDDEEGRGGVSAWAYECLGALDDDFDRAEHMFRQAVAAHYG